LPKPERHPALALQPQPLQLVELTCQFKILLCQSTRIMGCECERDLVPTDVYVGMMPRLFCHLRHVVHEFHRNGEILEFVSARDSGAFLFPFRDGTLRRLDLSRS